MKRVAKAAAALACLAGYGWALDGSGIGIEEAQKLLDQGRYVRVLEIARDGLRRNPQSVEALYLMGAVLYRGEGNLPLAQNYLERAEQRLERVGFEALDVAHRNVYLEDMSDLVAVCGQSEQYGLELSLIDRVARTAGIDWTHRRGWALMKLGRFEEARQLMLPLLQSKSVQARLTAMNTLGSIEATAENLEGAYDWFTKLLPIANQARDPDLATFYSNRGEVGLPLLKFPQAESDFLESAQHFSAETFSNPWSDLTMLYTGEAKLPLAAEAARHMIEWDRSTDIAIEQHRWNLDQRVLAMLLVAAGRDETALKAMDRVLARPDREGSTTSDPAEAEICLLAVYAETLGLNRERALERMSWSAPKDWLQSIWDYTALSAKQMAARTRLASLTIRKDRVDWLLRPYTPDSTIPEWLRSPAVQALGDGLPVHALRRLLARKGPAAKREEPYLRAVLGEELARKGNAAEAVRELSESLRTLPPEEVLLQAREQAVLAIALEDTGHGKEAAQWYTRAFEANPPIFRSLGRAIPARIVAAGDPVSQTAASWLRSSPRFRTGSVFTVQVARAANGMQATLLGASGAVLARAYVRPAGNAKETARSLCKEIHEKFFAAKVNWSQSGIDSLDGSPMSGPTGD